MWKKKLYWWLRRAAFDRRLRQKTFWKLTILIWANVFMLDYAAKPPSNVFAKIIFFVFQWSASFLLKTGWILVLVSEFATTIFENSPDTMVDFVAAAGAGLLLSCGVLVCDLAWLFSSYNSRKTHLVELFILGSTLYQWMIWTEGSIRGSIPIHFRVRTTPDGHPNPQYFDLLVWYKMDLCQFMPAPMPPNAAYFVPLQLPIELWMWPSIQELPPWISMKMGQLAAAPG